MSEEEKRKSYDKIREIDNKIYNVKLTFLEMEQLRLWLSKIESAFPLNSTDIEERILERIEIALDESTTTGDSV